MQAILTPVGQKYQKQNYYCKNIKNLVLKYNYFKNSLRKIYFQ